MANPNSENVARWFSFMINSDEPNKSLDASGISGLVIDNLSVTWLTAAASTQPFGGYFPQNLEHLCNQEAGDVFIAVGSWTAWMKSGEVCGMKELTNALALVTLVGD